MPKENYFNQNDQGELFDKDYEEKLEAQEKSGIFSEEELEATDDLVDRLAQAEKDRKNQEFFEKIKEEKEDDLSYLRGRRDLK